MFLNNKKNASSQVNLVLTAAVMFTVIALLSSFGIKSYQQKTFKLGYDNTLSKIQDGMTTLNIAYSDYFHSPMYSEDELTDYSLKPGKFLQEIIGISKDCGNSNGDCFASKYKDENNNDYKPVFEGACAILKSGPVICIKPQIKNNNITGIMDLNGKGSPNILGKDLRTFEINARVKTYSDEDDSTGEVNYVYMPAQKEK